MGALVTEGVEIPPNSLVLGMPGRVVREVGERELAAIAHAAEHYVEAGQAYQDQSSNEKQPRPSQDADG